MKTIIAGSRSISDMNLLLDAIKNSGFDITEVFSGGAKGVDRLGERWATENNIKLWQFIPDYDEHGKSAPLLRNIEMAKLADALIAIWDGKSRGTKHMIEQANKYSLRTYVTYTSIIYVTEIE